MEQTGKNEKFTILLNALRRGTKLYFIVGLPLLIAFMTELIQRKTILRTITWISEHAMAFILEYLIVFFVFALFSLLINRFGIGFLIASLLFTIMATINYYKLNIRGEPLFPWDFLSQGEFFNIAGSIDIQFEIRIVSIILTLILIYPIIRTQKRFFIGVVKHVILFICVLSAFVGSIYFVYFNNSILSKLNISHTNYDQKSNYENNGFIFAFTNSIGDLINDKPSGYGKEGILNVVGKMRSVTGKTAVSDIKPNIIMIMNEAFWDPTLLPNVSFSEDPLATVHKLEQKGNTGWLSTPQFGGGTANVEFEALTGFTMDFLPSDAMAYQQYIKHDFKSIVSILNSQGYNSVALHPYERTFWNRDKVYNYFGFSKFITQEEFDEEDYKGGYISDDSTYKKIIEIYEENQETNKPFFNFTVTMQNHYMYSKEKYSKKDSESIKISSEKLSEKDKEIIQAYAVGAKDADQMLKNLIDYFSKIKDPTIIVFFGDHLPSLDGYDVYQNTGFVSAEDDFGEYAKKLNKTPLIVWNNYNKTIKNPGYLTANYLSPYLLSEFELETPNFFEYLNHLRTNIPTYRNGVVVSSDSGKKSLTTKQQDLWNDYKLLQYDYMFGKHYGEKDMYKTND